jgi:hypothetical protein
MNLRSLLLPVLAALALAATPALAQYTTRPAPVQVQVPPAPPSAAPAPAPAAAPAAAPAKPAALPVVPPHTCVAPTFPAKDAVNAKVVAFNADYKTYGDCIKKYVEDNRAWVNAVVEVDNKAIDEYNKYNETLKQSIEAAKKD